MESKNCPAILCKDIADHLHYLYIIAPDFFEAEKRSTLVMNLCDMLHIIVLIAFIYCERSESMALVEHVMYGCALNKFQFMCV